MKWICPLLCLLALWNCNPPEKTDSSPAKTKQYALVVSLKQDSAVIARYEAYHRHVWPDVERAFRRAGILQFKIYRFGHQTFLLMTTRADFDLKRDLAKISGPKVAEWDKRMAEFQTLTGQEQWLPLP